MGLDPASLSPAFKACMAFHRGKLPPSPGTTTTVKAVMPKLNKTEAAFLAILKTERPGCWIGVQNIALILGHDTRYYPDLWCYDIGGVTAYEVKGFFRDDAKVKIKVAATLFPWIKFVLVFKDKSGWRREEVKRIPIA